MTSDVSSIGLFSSDPNSMRMDSLTRAFSNLGVEVHQVIPWKISRVGGTNNHTLKMNEFDLSELDMLLVLDVGIYDIGSFINRIGILSALSEMGVEIVNSVSSILIMRNKAETMRKLISSGLNVPRTLITESINEAAHFIIENNPCVLKPVIGFGGVGVQLIESQFDIENIYDYLKFFNQIFGKGAFLLQEYIENAGFDIRALVLDGEVIASMKRMSANGFLTNIHAGGKPQPNDIDINEIALKAADSVQGHLVGVDILPDSEGQYWLLEVNATPGWGGLQKITKFDIAYTIASSLANR
jgi:tetrahydromethanopterin:alpha-L-glutamate ligase